MSPTDNLPNVFPNHPHRQLYILISVLLFVIVAGSIILYQIRNVKEKEQNITPIVKSTELSSSQRAQIISNLNEIAAKSPPLTNKQRDQIIENLNKAAANQNK